MALDTIRRVITESYLSQHQAVSRNVVPSNTSLIGALTTSESSTSSSRIEGICHERQGSVNQRGAGLAVIGRRSHRKLTHSSPMPPYEVLSGYGCRNGGEELWFIAAEEGPAQVRVYRFDTERETRQAMAEYRCCRVLYSPEGVEKEALGWNGMALATIRRVMNENYLAWS